jgi:hypothetical protein
MQINDVLEYVVWLPSLQQSPPCSLLTVIPSC